MPLAPEVLLTWQGTETLERDVSTTLKTTFFPPKIGIWAPPNGMGTSQRGALLCWQNSSSFPGSQTTPKSPEQGQGWGSRARKTTLSVRFGTQGVGNLYPQPATQGTAG